MIAKENLQVAAIVVAAVSLIVVGDVAGRLLTAAGFTPFAVAWARFAIAVAVLAPFCGLRRAELPQLLHAGVILRGCIIAAAISCILTALKTEALATVFGGFFVGPIVAYGLSALLLKEQVTLLRTALVLICFGGVLLVVKPGFGMTTGLVFALMAGTLHGCYLVATRWLASAYRPRFLLFSQLLIGTIVLAPVAVGPIPALSLNLGGLILISALGSAFGNLLIAVANRRAEASVIAPLIYSQIIVATILGFLVFGEWPDQIALLGLAIIIVAGVGSVWASGRAR